jgi:hypothetical protein
MLNATATDAARVALVSFANAYVVVALVFAVIGAIAVTILVQCGDRIFAPSRTIVDARDDFILPVIVDDDDGFSLDEVTCP